jgi:hypothetical protein
VLRAGESAEDRRMNSHRQSGATRQPLDVHVAWRSDRKDWQVEPTGRDNTARNFRLRAHAIAFARAVASSRAAELIVSDRNGKVTRHDKDSLSYPTTLD